MFLEEDTQREIHTEEGS